MALILKSNSDLVYLPDHGFVGEEGALRILVQVTRQIRQIDASQNFLGTEGTLTLIKGLTSLRGRYSNTETGIWGLRKVNLAQNGVGDEALDAVLGYAKKDVLLREVYLQANEIELRDHLHSIIHNLNSSRIQLLSLTNNVHLDSPSLTTFLSGLSAPHLTHLYMSNCNLGPALVPSLIAYLRSPRSRNLVHLQLNGNCLGLDGVRGIIDAVEAGNFGLTGLELYANDAKRVVVPDMPVGAGGTGEDTDRMRAENEQLSGEVERIPPILKRNDALTRRIRRAAARCLAPARILLHAKPPRIEEIAGQAIADVSAGTTHHGRFRILDLPSEVLQLVVRHCSGDAAAFSDAQFSRLRKEAADRESLRRMVRTMNARMRVMQWEVRGGAVLEVRDEWLARGRWDKWECDVSRYRPDKGAGGVDGDEESSGGEGGSGDEDSKGRAQEEEVERQRKSRERQEQMRLYYHPLDGGPSQVSED